MKNKLWRFIARIVSSEPVRTWLINRALKTPDTHIGDYMERYWLFHYKRKFFKWSYELPFSVRIHFIKRPDADPYVHDHPWNWRTIILAGWYTEEDSTGYKWVHEKGDTQYRTAFDPHRIDVVSGKGVVSLFIMYRYRNKWGFYVGDPARKVYYKDYVSTNDRGIEHDGCL